MSSDGPGAVSEGGGSIHESLYKLALSVLRKKFGELPDAIVAKLKDADEDVLDAINQEIADILNFEHLIKYLNIR
ncbi:MAG: hypothetical protein FWE70_01480 [Oscillospiraceae bacterium]|nr:hypothetical protein [Oscillospiraceae bacterium]